MSQLTEPLAAARRAAQGGMWREAYSAYLDAGESELAPADLEQFGEAAWWSGRLDEAIDLRTRAYAGFQAAGDRPGAARMALALSNDHLGRGAFAVSHGWFAKAERALTGLPEGVEHAHLLLGRAMRALRGHGNTDTALAELQRAYELGEAHGDGDVQALSLVLRGHALVQSGEVDEGLALLDEATAAAVGGELRPFAAGFVYCCTIASCHDIGDVGRAAEWTEAANRWCDRLDMSGFPGACRVHRAQIMRMRGDWPAAEAQAVAACAELQDFDRWVTGAGFYEIGEIRRRRGDFAAAAKAYATAEDHGFDPEPGAALLRLAEGKVDGAVGAIRRTLDAVAEPLARFQRLPAQVEIGIASGDLPSARAAAQELERIIDAYRIGAEPAPAFDAALHLATGRIRLAEDDIEGATRCLRRAREDWMKVGAPYETAEARTELGSAYRRQGDEDGAMTEFQAALTVFQRLGARLDEERVKQLMGRRETRRTFVFTDIVGSTKLLDILGDEKWSKLLRRHDELLRDRIQGNGGEVIKHTGDGLFVAFEHPKAAIEGAVAIQRALDDEVVAPDVRIGIHTGDAFRAESALPDYGGHGVHLAARIGAAAGAGEILVSQETLDGLGGGFRVAETRSETFKGFAEPVVVASLDWR